MAGGCSLLSLAISIAGFQLVLIRQKRDDSHSLRNRVANMGRLQQRAIDRAQLSKHQFQGLGQKLGSSAVQPGCWEPWGCKSGIEFLVKSPEEGGLTGWG